MCHTEPFTDPRKIAIDILSAGPALDSRPARIGRHRFWSPIITAVVGMALGTLAWAFVLGPLVAV